MTSRSGGWRSSIPQGPQRAPCCSRSSGRNRSPRSAWRPEPSWPTPSARRRTWSRCFARPRPEPCGRGGGTPHTAAAATASVLDTDNEFVDSDKRCPTPSRRCPRVQPLLHRPARRARAGLPRARPHARPRRACCSSSRRKSSSRSPSCARACASTPATSAGCSRGWSTAGSSRASAPPPTAGASSPGSPPRARPPSRCSTGARPSETGAQLDGLGEAEQRRLVAALAEVRAAARAGPAGAQVVLRPPRAGDLGWVIERHGELYAQEYGWNAEFEALVAQIVADFAQEHDPAREAVVDRRGRRRPAGCVFCVRQADDVAKLRLLLVEPRARGLGLGARLVDECIALRPRAGYRELRAVDERRRSSMRAASTSAPASARRPRRTARSATTSSARPGRSACRTTCVADGRRRPARPSRRAPLAPAARCCGGSRG